MTGNGETACCLHRREPQNGTIYTGVTSSLLHRGHQHRDGLTAGFSKRYECKLLVWYELCADMPAAIAREKQLKGGSRAKKLALIEAINPDWKDLYPSIAF